jgi:hypothetical protein
MSWNTRNILSTLQNMSNQVDTAVRKNYVRIRKRVINLNKRPMDKQAYKSSFRAR